MKRDLYKFLAGSAAGLAYTHAASLRRRRVNGIINDRSSSGASGGWVHVDQGCHLLGVTLALAYRGWGPTPTPSNLN